MECTNTCGFHGAIRDNDDNTPLHHAAAQGWNQCMRTLLAVHGNLLDVKNAMGVKLLDRGRNVNITHTQAKCNSTSVSLYLLSYHICVCVCVCVCVCMSARARAFAS